MVRGGADAGTEVGRAGVGGGVAWPTTTARPPLAAQRDAFTVPESHVPSLQRIVMPAGAAALAGAAAAAGAAVVRIAIAGGAAARCVMTTWRPRWFAQPLGVAGETR